MTSTLRAAFLVLPLLLAGCQTQLIADCKTGDWKAIGYKDGVAGETVNYAERKDFCDDHSDNKAAASAPADYTAGWAQGNWNLWSGLGQEDGRKGQLPQFESHGAKMQPNHQAYDAGWEIGNSEYWKDLGLREGGAGRPLHQREVNRDNAAAMHLRYDEAAYSDGWHAGNRSYWRDAGINDARNGVADSEFRARAAAAKAAGVLVQEDAYRDAWNAEIVNYWKNLGTSDAVSGKDFAMRRKEAQQKGLKIYETEYRQAWERRLEDYWRQVGKEDGYGRPFQLEDRMANAGRDGVFVIPGTRDLYTAAWEEQNAKYCVPELAFEQGRRNAGMAVDVCRPDLRGQLKRAYLSGQDYAAEEARYNQAVSDANQISDHLHDAHRRLNRLEAEIRAGLDAKDRVVNDDTMKQDRRREQDRRELSDYIQRLEQQLDEARRWTDRHQQQMQRLRRDIYLN